MQAKRRSGSDAASAAEGAWDEQAEWYDRRHGTGGDDLYRELLLPAVLRQLDVRPEQRILDCCCGSGVLGRLLVAQGVSVCGVDASAAMIARARERAAAGEDYRVGDARELDALLTGERFDHAALVLALQDLDPIEPVLAGIAAVLAPGGRLVVVLVHPCLRPPKRSAWGREAGDGKRYRRIDAYLQSYQARLRTHPGSDPDGASTVSHHRPLSTYLNALGVAGFGVTACEELCNPRRGTRGKASAEEERLAREFPLFLLLTAQRGAQLTE